MFATPSIRLGLLPNEGPAVILTLSSSLLSNTLASFTLTFLTGWTSPSHSSVVKMFATP